MPAGKDRALEPRGGATLWIFGRRDERAVACAGCSDLRGADAGSDAGGFAAWRDPTKRDDGTNAEGRKLRLRDREADGDSQRKWKSTGNDRVRAGVDAFGPRFAGRETIATIGRADAGDVVDDGPATERCRNFCDARNRVRGR